MAFYSYSNYNFQGELNHSDCYSYPLQDPIADYQNFAYDPFPSTISYSISTPADPTYFQYDPAPVQFSISYSVAEFNEPDFEEYDPTPYGGGYNLALTYGAALPPSDAICYPRAGSAPPSAVPSAARKIEAESKPPAPPALPPSSVPPAAGKIEAESKPTHSDGARTENDFVAGDDVVPRGEEESGSAGSFKYGYGYENGAGRMPYGYGLEAMDMCESLFGYWPCISRYRREMRDFEQVGECGNCGNPWDGTVDYLFGSTNPYEEKKFESDGVDSCMHDDYMHSLHHRVDDSWF